MATMQAAGIRTYKSGWSAHHCARPGDFGVPSPCQWPHISGYWYVHCISPPWPRARIASVSADYCMHLYMARYEPRHPRSRACIRLTTTRARTPGPRTTQRMHHCMSYICRLRGVTPCPAAGSAVKVRMTEVNTNMCAATIASRYQDQVSGQA